MPGTNKFISLPFIVAKQMDALIIPLVVTGTDKVWPKGTLSLTYGQRASIYSLPPIDSREYKTAHELKTETRKRINTALMS